MPFAGNGSFNSLGSPTFPAVPNTFILASYFNANLNDIFLGFGNCVTRDGQSAATADLPMASFTFTNLRAASLAGHPLVFGQTDAQLTDLTATTLTAITLVATTLTVTTLSGVAEISLEDGNVTGVLSLPTPASNINTTQAVNGAWVNTWYAPKNSPAFTGVPTAPTAALGTNTPQLATMAAIQAAIVNLPAGALPNTTGQKGKVLTNNGAGLVSWGYAMPLESVTTTSVQAQAGVTYSLESAANRTNLILYSDSFDNGSWSRIGIGTGVAPVVTPNAGIDPEGKLTADRVDFNKGAGTTTGDYSQLIQNAGAGITPGLLYTNSIWVKAATAGDIGKTIMVMDVNTDYGPADATTLTASWKRVERTKVSFDTNSRNGLITQGGQGTSDTVSVLVWRAQCEQNAFATAGIPTGATAGTAGSCVVAPANPAPGDKFSVMLTNGRFDNVIDWAGKPHKNFAAAAQTDPSMTLDTQGVLELTFINNTIGWEVN